MKKLCLILISFIALGTQALPGHAQETRFGLGIGLGSSALGGGDTDIIESLISPTSIYVPITFAGFRIEPEVGFLRFSAEGDNFENSRTLLQVGTGVFVLRPVVSTNLYFGGRVGITRQSITFGVDNEDSSTNPFFAPAAGAEHLFGDNFSLGGEVQLMYTSFDEDDDDQSTSLLRTRAVFFVRWHF